MVKEQVTNCRICKNIYGEWGVHYYVEGPKTNNFREIEGRYRHIKGGKKDSERDRLIRKVRKMGFKNFWDGNSEVLTAL